MPTRRLTTSPAAIPLATRQVAAASGRAVPKTRATTSVHSAGKVIMVLNGRSACGKKRARLRIEHAENSGLKLFVDLGERNYVLHGCYMLGTRQIRVGLWPGGSPESVRVTADVDLGTALVAFRPPDGKDELFFNLSRAG